MSILLLLIFGNFIPGIMKVDGNDFPQSQVTTEVIVPLISYNIDIKTNYPEIAFVKPIFTAAAYARYYYYYSCFNKQTCTAEAAPSYLRNSPVNSWSTSSGAPSVISLIKEQGYPNEKISVITDLDVHLNKLYTETGEIRFSTIIFFHNEYVTMNEYHNMVQFIKNGGNVIILNGNAFFGEVDYDPVDNKVILVDGHGFTFDGSKAELSANYYRFVQSIGNFEHREWFGSRYCAFRKGSTEGAIFKENLNTHPISRTMLDNNISVMSPSYQSHEENCAITPNIHTIADWKTSFPQSDRGIKIYEIFPHGPIGGSLIHFGFFGTDLNARSESATLTIIESIKHQAGLMQIPWIRYPSEGSYHSNSVTIDFENYYPYEVYLNGTHIPDAKRYSSLQLEEGYYNLTVAYEYQNETIQKSVGFHIDNTDPTITPVIEYHANNTLSKLEFLAEDSSLGLASAYLYGPDPVGEFPFTRGNGSGNVLLNVLKSYKNFQDNTSYGIRVDVIDSAGNKIMEFYNFSTGLSPHSPLSETNMFKGDFEQINSTTGWINLGATSPAIIPKLRVSEDFGESWIEVAVDNVNNQSSAYYTRNGDHFWYSVYYYDVDLTLLETYRDMRSFYWDQDLTYITSMDRSDNGTHTSMEIFFNQAASKNRRLNLTIKGESGKILAQNSGLSNSSHYRVLFPGSVGNLYLNFKDMQKGTSITRVLKPEFQPNPEISINKSIGDEMIILDPHLHGFVDEVIYIVNDENFNHSINVIDQIEVTGSNIAIQIMLRYEGDTISQYQLVFDDAFKEPYAIFSHSGSTVEPHRIQFGAGIMSNGVWKLNISLSIFSYLYTGNLNEYVFLDLTYYIPFESYAIITLSLENSDTEIHGAFVETILIPYSPRINEEYENISRTVEKRTRVNVTETFPPITTSTMYSPIVTSTNSTAAPFYFFVITLMLGHVSRSFRKKMVGKQLIKLAHSN